MEVWAKVSEFDQKGETFCQSKSVLPKALLKIYILYG